MYAIWWLSQFDCEQLMDLINLLNLPSYIVAQFYSRVGRAGRGRLWVAEHISLNEIEWNEDKPTAKMAEKCGGIVINFSHVENVISLPGFVTDTKLDFIKVLPARAESQLKNDPKNEQL